MTDGDLSLDFQDQVRYGTYSDAYEIMRPRTREFGGKEAMSLAAIAADPGASREFEDYVDSALARTKRLMPAKEGYDEVVIGGGLHAAIYCATRVAMGKPKPLVIERGRLGGVFASSKRPVFWLNSRNRPGGGGLPSENAALNVVPGAPVQMSHLSAGEFQSNADLAYVIRCSLLKHARIRQGWEVDYVTRAYNLSGASTRMFGIKVKGAKAPVFTDRVIDARGLGDPLSSADDKRVLNFGQFMAMMDKPFPLRGLKRVAVIGDGDSARTIIEALLGQGPNAHMSVAALDWVEQVDWYAPSVLPDCPGFKSSTRARYLGLSGFLSQPDNGVARLRVFSQRGQVTPTPDSLSVNGRFYDHAFTATGWDRSSLWSDLDENYDTFGYPASTTGGGVVQSTATKVDDCELYRIGPAATLPFDGFEAASSVGRLTQNVVALFRLGWRTAATASSLD